MAGVGGPIRSLPGSVLTLPSGATCDEHQDRPAVKRIQGETDSFGYESFDMCQECYDKYLAEKESPEANMGHCDWCKKGPFKLIPTRDLDEGMTGPVYHVCSPCKIADSERLRREYEEQDSDWY